MSDVYKYHALPSGVYFISLEHAGYCKVTLANHGNKGVHSITGIGVRIAVWFTDGRRGPKLYHAASVTVRGSLHDHVANPKTNTGQSPNGWNTYFHAEGQIVLEGWEEVKEGK